MASHNELGKRGEKAALNYLQALGYQILERNWRFGKAEIDIIGKKDRILIFFEVKSRSSTKWGQPEDSIDNRKMELLMDGAYHYMDLINHTDEIRFDIISILFPEKAPMVLDHFKDAIVP